MTQGHSLNSYRPCQGSVIWSIVFFVRHSIHPSTIMGNTETHDLTPLLKDSQKELNLSRRVNHKQFRRHLKGEFSEGCMSEIPWSIRDSVWLYEKMNVSFNLLTQIPPELPLRLPHLYYVDLSYNQLMSLPESFGLLPHLRTVLLQNNKLMKLPPTFTRLAKLEKLDLSKNMLHDLPEDLGNMASLSRLNVSHNRLTKLPLSLGTSQTLTVLLAKHNRLETPSQSICDEGSEAALKLLRQLVPDGARISLKVTINVFPRIRGNQLQFSNPNPHSAIVEYMQSQTNTTNTASRIKTPLLPPLGSSALDVSELKDRIIGLIYGAAIGDALGLSTQWMTTDECKFHYNPETLTYAETITDEHRVHWKRGDWTSNFDQVALVLDSLIHWAGVVDELDFAKSLQNWSMHGFQELGDKEAVQVSDSIFKVVSTAKYLEDPHYTARKLSDAEDADHLFADNGALARALVLGIPQFHNLEEVAGNAVRICKATHTDPRAIASSVMMAVTVSLMLQGHHNLSSEAALNRLLDKAKEVAIKYLPDPEQCKDFNRYTTAKTFASLHLDEHDRPSYVLKTMGAGLCALNQGGKNFRSVLMQIVMLGADSTSNACIAGGLLGCRVGYSRLPHLWVEGLRPQQVDWLNIKINLLLDMMGIP